MKVSIQGVKGAFHEEAALKYFQSAVEIVPQLTFEDVVNSVEKSHVEYGIMAIENTISGTIHANFNLIKSSNLEIVGEVYLRIEQHLAVLPGTKLYQLKQVHSHYMAINQCREFFKPLPQIKLVESEDTALSMQMVAQKGNYKRGAIGSRLAAKHYGLEIIGEGIETNKKNYTRFLIVAPKNKLQIQDQNKASIHLLLPHKKGTLASVLSLIDEANINLSKIESMPVIGEPWHYQFYMDVNYKNISDYQQMVKQLETVADQMTVLGSYKQGDNVNF